jgi:putative drug exporter of the RND superfamily
MGVTIGVGLMLDTLIVRTFVLPSLVALLGRWFWWPTPTRHRTSAMTRECRPTSSRSTVA